VTHRLIPARASGRDLRAYCCGCSTVHVHSLDDEQPKTLCAADTLGAWLGYELVLVGDDVTNDKQLAALAIDVWLLGNGWRQCPGRDLWRHPVFGRVHLVTAAVVQSRVDALHVHQLEREPHPC